MENSMKFHGIPLNFMEVSSEFHGIPQKHLTDFFHEMFSWDLMGNSMEFHGIFP
jgi:hypothetical protein